MLEGHSNSKDLQDTMLDESELGGRKSMSKVRKIPTIPTTVATPVIDEIAYAARRNA
jgi:hypothetical protein